MRALYLLPTLLFLILAGMLGWRLLYSPAAPAGGGAQAMLNQPLPAFDLPLLFDEGTLDSKTLNGTPYLLHFFASWCTSCATESDVWRRLKNDARLRRYAVAWNDPPEKTREWLEKHGNDFDDVLTDEAGKYGVQLGITGVPETLLIGADGKILWRWSAPLTQDVAQKQLLPLIGQIAHAP